MEKEKTEINVLDELNKGACMGQDAIHFIMDKVEEKQLKKVLEKQYKKYNEITDKISKLYPEYSTKKPHETNAMNKAMTWYGIEMKTMMDDTTSKLAELLMQGTNMGIIEGRRLLNQNQNGEIDEEVKQLLNDYVSMQEDSVETLKKYL